MAEDKKKIPVRPQNVYIENRENMSVTGVTDIESFDEESIILYTDLGLISIHGQGLHISRIDLDSGELAVDGGIASICYEDGYSGRSGLFTRLFR